MNSDVKLEKGNSNKEDFPENLSPHVYHPMPALKAALSEWLEEFKKPRDVRGPVVKTPPPVPLPPPVATCAAITPTTHTASPAVMTMCPPADMHVFSTITYTGAEVIFLYPQF